MVNGKIVRALDVGYGNVKFVRRHETLESPVGCDMFPSRAPAASGSRIGEGTLKARETVVVRVGDIDYEVGHDVEQAQGANDVGLTFDDKFVRSPGYMARVLGALHYMFIELEQNHIDLLVVGLPVNNMANQKDYLINKLIGKHELPQGRVVEIKDVRVFEQPLGAFFNFMYSPDEVQRLSFQEVKSQRNLIIDPGMYTFDWLLIDNMKGNGERSGGTSKAMSEVISKMAKAISADEKTPESQVFNILDEAIRTNRTPRIFGKDINLEKYIKRGQSVIEESVNAMANKIGDGANVDNIILVGGGASFFLDAISKKYSRHKIITTNNSVFANVIGFQMAGERYFLRDQVSSRKTALG